MMATTTNDDTMEDQQQSSTTTTQQQDADNDDTYADANADIMQTDEAAADEPADHNTADSSSASVEGTVTVTPGSTTTVSTRLSSDGATVKTGSSGNSRETASSVFGGLGFLVNTAKIISEVSFASAKFGTSLGLGIARGIIDGVGDVTGLSDVGVTPLISNTLHLAERVAHLGIDTGRFWTRFGLDAAGVSIGSLDHVFGSTETARAISEFAKLVQREMERSLEFEDEDFGGDDDTVKAILDVGADGDVDMDGALVVKKEDVEARKKSLKNIGFIDTVKAVVAWVCLLRLTRPEAGMRAIASCSSSMTANSTSGTTAGGDAESFGDSSNIDVARIVELDDNAVGDDVDLESIVFEPVVASDAASDDGEVSIVLGHLGQASDESTDSTWTTNPIDDPTLLPRQLRRYMRFSSGAYGRHAVRFLYGDKKASIAEIFASGEKEATGSVHPDHTFYSKHTGTTVDDVYHTTFHNKAGAKKKEATSSSSSSSSFSTISPSMLLPENTTHYQPTFYIIVDHSQKAIVVSLRGTLSLHDAMVDLTCDYSRVSLHGSECLVHSGMHQAALRVALPAEEWIQKTKEAAAAAAVAANASASSTTDGSDQPTNTTKASDFFKAAPRPPRVFEAVKAGLLAFPSYSLIITGHSLGAGIASLLALHWGDPKTGTIAEGCGLPGAGVTRIHCYAYASPAVVADVSSSSSSSATSSHYRGLETLVTSIMLNDDLVPRLSLGSVRDLTNVVAWMHSRSMAAKSTSNDSVGTALIKAATSSTSSSGGPITINGEPVADLLKRVQTACFKNDKLYPAGRVLWLSNEKGVSGSAGFTSDAVVRRGSEPSTTTTSGSKKRNFFMRQVVNPEGGVLEGLVFSSSMVTDHFPTSYSEALESL
ncbi:hypothetical protein HDU76_012742 [Blyttiomyces sp. JEL0837]|nr:hypothetical protein HDU76_012742 [Blyttiomyces sp. JEL0837]